MSRLVRFLRLPTTKNIVINTGGTYLNIAFAAFYTVFLARVFDRVEFGVLSVLLVFSYVLANILNFGMPASIYAHLPDIAHDKKKAFEFLKSNVLLLTGFSLLGVVIALALTDYLDTHVFKLQAPFGYYLIALTGTFLFIIQNFVRDSLNAVGDFFHINVAQNISNAIKACLLLILATFSKITIGNTLFVLNIVGPLVVFAAVILERKWIVSAFVNAPITRQSIKVKYTFQYFLSTQLSLLATRIDLFLVAFFLLPVDKGDYALSQRIVVAIVTTSDSITQVLSPQFAKAKEKNDIILLFKKACMYMLLPSCLFLGVSLTPTWIYNLIFTQKYAMSIPVTRLLSLAYIPFSFAAILVLFFLYTLKKPFHVLVSNAILLLIFGLGDYILIPRLGLLAPPLVTLIGFLFGFAYLGSFVILELYGNRTRR